MRRFAILLLVIPLLVATAVNAALAPGQEIVVTPAPGQQVVVVAPAGETLSARTNNSKTQTRVTVSGTYVPPGSTPVPPTPVPTPTPIATPAPPPGAIRLYDFNGTGSIEALGPDWGWDMAMVGIVDQPMNRYAMFRADPTLVEVSNGTLKLKARHNANGTWDQVYISTRGKFTQQYGIFKARMKIPAGHALWPSFWTLDTQSGTWDENDVIEAYPEPVNPYYTVCFPGNAACTTFDLPADYSTAFHVYELEWRSNVAIARLDGVEQGRTTVPVMSPQMLLLTMAVGVWFEDRAPDATTPNNPQLEVDWVGVWP